MISDVMVKAELKSMYFPGHKEFFKLSEVVNSKTYNSNIKATNKKVVLTSVSLTCFLLHDNYWGTRVVLLSEAYHVVFITAAIIISVNQLKS